MTDNRKVYGFRPLRSLYGGDPLGAIQRYRVASGYNGTVNSIAVDVNAGDPVTILSTGYVQLQVGSEGTQGRNTGVVVGVGPSWDGTLMQFKTSIPNSTTYGTVLERTSYVWVCHGDGIVFEADCDDSSTATTEAAYTALIGSNVDHVLTTGIQPKANPMIDISSTNTTNTLLWRVIDISPTIENQDFSGLYVKLLVTPNISTEPPQTVLGL